MTIAMLDDAIRKVCPILGVCSNGRIDYAPEATDAQIEAANDVLAEWDIPRGRWKDGTGRNLLCEIASARSTKLVELEAAREAAENACVTAGNVQLASSEYDQRRLATLLVGINEAVAIGLYSSESMIEITDASDRDIPLTVGQFKLLAVAYMGECMKQRKAYRELRARIEAATTAAELEEISIE